MPVYTAGDSFPVDIEEKCISSAIEPTKSEKTTGRELNLISLMWISCVYGAGFIGSYFQAFDWGEQHLALQILFAFIGFIQAGFVAHILLVLFSSGLCFFACVVIKLFGFKALLPPPSEHDKNSGK